MPVFLRLTVQNPKIFSFLSFKSKKRKKKSAYWRIKIFWGFPLRYQHSIITINPMTHLQIFSVFLINAVVLILNIWLPQQVAHSTCGDSEYNLRSRTVVCGSCGLPSDKSSNCSVTSASRSFRSGGISEGLLPHSYVFSTSTPRKVGTAAPTADIWAPEVKWKIKAF